MVGGLDRYFQVARCFRDEDLRADRQPEFTQIDIEMSFAEERDIISVVEKLVDVAFKEGLGVDVRPPFTHMTYAEARSRFGSDKPDLRAPEEIQALTSIFYSTQFERMKTVIQAGVP